MRRLFPKFEIRISKSETISKLEILESKTQVRIEFVWNIGSFCHLILFRASDFVLRICLFIPWRPLRPLREIFRAVTSTHFNASVRSIDTTSLRCQTRLFPDRPLKRPLTNALRRP